MLIRRLCACGAEYITSPTESAAQCGDCWLNGIYAAQRTAEAAAKHERRRLRALRDAYLYCLGGQYCDHDGTDLTAEVIEPWCIYAHELAKYGPAY